MTKGKRSLFLEAIKLLFCSVFNIYNLFFILIPPTDFITVYWLCRSMGFIWADLHLQITYLSYVGRDSVEATSHDFSSVLLPTYSHLTRKSHTQVSSVQCAYGNEACGTPEEASLIAAAAGRGAKTGILSRKEPTRVQVQAGKLGRSVLF